MKMKPLFDRVLLKPILADKEKNGIILTIHDNEKTNKAIVYTLGVGETVTKSGLKEGDIVLYNKFAGEPYVFDKVEYLLIEATEITAILLED